MKDLNTLVQRRAFERRPANVNICFCYSGIFYSGVVTNVSEKGMFVRTMVNLPEGLIFPLIIHREAESLNVLARVRHQEKEEYVNNGIGVEIISQPAYFYSELFEHK